MRAPEPEAQPYAPVQPHPPATEHWPVPAEGRPATPLMTSAPDVIASVGPASQPVVEPAPAPVLVAVPPRRARSFRHRVRIPPLAVAGLAGVLLFAGLSGFGREVRVATPLGAQLDHLLRSAGFAINEIAISGHRLTLDADVFAALRIDAETSILAYDVVSARKRIEEISWVAEAHVARLFPDKLRIVITERKPLALWRHGDQQALIDATGRVLARVAKGSQPSLPVVAGEGAPAAAAELLGALELHPGLAQRVESATRVGQRRWSLALTDGTLIHLPEASAADALRRLADMDRRARLLSRPYQTIDLRRAGLVALGPVPKRASAAGPDRRATRETGEP